MFAINDAHCKNIYENRYSYGTVSVNNYTLVYKNICNNKFSRCQRCWLLTRSFLPCQARFLARFAFRCFALVLPHFLRKKKIEKIWHTDTPNTPLVTVCPVWPRRAATAGVMCRCASSVDSRECSKYGSPLKHPLSYPNCTPSTLTTWLPPLKTRNNYIFGKPAALTALLSTLKYWLRGLKLLGFQLNFSVL